MTVFVTHIQPKEGDEWQPFVLHKLTGNELGRVHAIKFGNGGVWDTYNGWRHPTNDRLWAPPPEFKSEPEAAPFYDPYYDEDETVEVDELERKLMGLRQMIGRSGGGTVLNMHDKDDLFHFSIEGFLQHPEEKSDARPRKTE
jgi:hypothetical protein